MRATTTERFTFDYATFNVPRDYEIPYPICARPLDTIIVQPAHRVAPLSIVRTLPWRNLSNGWRRRLHRTDDGIWMVPPGVRPPEPLTTSDRTGITFVFEGDWLQVIRNVRHGYWPAVLPHVRHLDIASSNPAGNEASVLHWLSAPHPETRRALTLVRV